MDFAMLNFKRIFLLLIITFAVTGCVTAPQVQLSSEANIVTVSKAAPTSNYEFINAIESTDGQGCGGFGYRGTYERAIILLRNKAATMEGDYIQVETVQTPHNRPTGNPQMPVCFDNKYTVKGLAYTKTGEYEASVMVTHSNKTEQVNNESLAKKLRDLKSLLDDKIITKEEFEAQKKKILNES
jgi:hypothetical protein